MGLLKPFIYTYTDGSYLSHFPMSLSTFTGPSCRFPSTQLLRFYSGVTLVPLSLLLSFPTTLRSFLHSSLHTQTSWNRGSTSERKHLILSFYVCIKITTVTFYSSFAVSGTKYELPDIKMQDHRLTNKWKRKAKDQGTRITQEPQGNMLKKGKKDKRIKFSLEI